MRIAFFGIYGLGAESLARLLARGARVVAAVTKPEGDGEVQPVAVLARHADLPLFQPPSPRDPDFVRRLEALEPEIIVVAGYPKILRRRLLRLPARGALNVHLSLLPGYRGPCPWKWAVVHGEKRLGATVHVMEERVDAGDILLQEEVPIERSDTGGSLFAKLCGVGARLLDRTLRDLAEGRAERRPQDERAASAHPAPTENDASIDWSASAERVRNLVRGFWPRPGAWTRVAETRTIVAEVEPAEGGNAAPGTVLRCSREGVRVAVGGGAVDVRRFVLAAGPVGPREAAETLRLRPGAVLGEGNSTFNCRSGSICA